MSEKFCFGCSKLDDYLFKRYQILEREEKNIQNQIRTLYEQINKILGEMDTVVDLKVMHCRYESTWKDANGNNVRLYPLMTPEKE